MVTVLVMIKLVFHVCRRCTKSSGEYSPVFVPAGTWITQSCAPEGAGNTREIKRILHTCPPTPTPTPTSPSATNNRKTRQSPCFDHKGRKKRIIQPKGTRNGLNSMKVQIFWT
ncbi:uncharacterized protein [Penaeus vannamei]|uniref:uncharacterized protein n=1 Tax=Penaeus vannamei TaxID=6689 RepID=UPI00387F5A6D